MNDNTSKKPTNDFDRVTDREKKQEWPPKKWSIVNFEKIAKEVTDEWLSNPTTKEKL